MKNMKLIMERFNRYEEEVLFEQKINEIQESFLGSTAGQCDQENKNKKRVEFMCTHHKI